MSAVKPKTIIVQAEEQKQGRDALLIIFSFRGACKNLNLQVVVSMLSNLVGLISSGAIVETIFFSNISRKHRFVFSKKL